MPKTFAQSLLKWYKKNARDLPWRHTADPYKIWISEIMLQQTTVNAVIPFYERWINVFPDIDTLAKASLQQVLKQWQGLGYYQRAKNIAKAAIIIRDEHNGLIPDDPERLKKLPGFGPYTVGAVLSIAFNKKYPIIDANVRRVIMRIRALNGVADPSQDKEILTYLENELPDKNMSSFNQALMELGALICKSKEPLCLLCPVKDFCQAYAKGLQEIIPQPKKKITKELKVAIGIFKNEGRYFIQQRPSKGLLGDLWEFPGGKVEKGESTERALARELKEEVDIVVKESQHLLNLVHFYTQFKVHLHVYYCIADTYPVKGSRRKWVLPNELKEYPMPSGSAKIVDHLLKIDKILG